jgi:hypothetical protein
MENNQEKKDFEALQLPQTGIYTPDIPYEQLATHDAFGRLRISDNFTLFESQHRYKENEKFDTSTVGAGSTTYVSNESCINMSVSTAANDEVIRESKRVFMYQPGKSLLMLSSFVFSTLQSNLRQRVGYFSTTNGIYFEADGTTLNLVIRSANFSERRIPQSQWNAHRFDGSTFFTRQIDVTKGNIFWVDIEWLGVGDVRCGFILDGSPVVAHIFHNENSFNTTYITTACLPIRYEIKNTGITASASTMKQICSTVISEGGYQSRALQNYGSTSIVTAQLKDTGSPGTLTPIISMKLRSDRLDAIALPTQTDIFCTSNDILKWTLLLNPTTLSTTSFSNYSTTTSNVMIDTSATTVSGGTVIGAGFIQQKGSTTLSGVDAFNLQLGRTIAGTSDVVTLAVISNGTNSKVGGGIGWYELI